MPKKSYILALLGMALAVFLGGCVDTSVQPIPSTIDYRSHVKVVNFADGVSSANFMMRNADGSEIDFGSIAFGDEDNVVPSFVDIPAGAKTLSFNSEALQFNTEVDRKIRLFVTGNSTDRTVKKFTQRYIFQTQDDETDRFFYRPDTAAIAFFNGSVDAEVTEIQAVSDIVDTSFTLSLGLGDGMGYKYLHAGNYTITVVSGETTISTMQVNLEAKKRYTAAIYDMQANLKNKVFTDD